VDEDQELVDPGRADVVGMVLRDVVVMDLVVVKDLPGGDVVPPDSQVAPRREPLVVEHERGSLFTLVRRRRQAATGAAMLIVMRRAATTYAMTRWTGVSDVGLEASSEAQIVTPTPITKKAEQAAAAGAGLGGSGRFSWDSRCDGTG
jgi:hypothetical protein